MTLPADIPILVVASHDKPEATMAGSDAPSPCSLRARRRACRRVGQHTPLKSTGKRLQAGMSFSAHFTRVARQQATAPPAVCPDRSWPKTRHLRRPGCPADQGFP